MIFYKNLKNYKNLKTLSKSLIFDFKNDGNNKFRVQRITRKSKQL